MSEVPPQTHPTEATSRLKKFAERVKSIVTGPKKAAEAAQVDNFGETIKAIEKYGSLEAARKAEPLLFVKGGALSILAGHPGKGPKS